MQRSLLSVKSALGAASAAAISIDDRSSFPFWKREREDVV